MPNLTEVQQSFKIRLLANLPATIPSTQFKWEGAPTSVSESIDWGRTTLTPLDSTTIAGKRQRHDYLYVIDLFFIKSNSQGIINKANNAIQALSEAFTNKEFDFIQTFDCDRASLDDTVKHLGRQISVRFYYEE